jgi:hypothetical protein
VQPALALVCVGNLTGTCLCRGRDHPEHLVRALFKLFDFQNQFLAAAHVLAEAAPLEAAQYIGAHSLVSAVLASAVPPSAAAGGGGGPPTTSPPTSAVPAPIAIVTSPAARPRADLVPLAMLLRPKGRPSSSSAMALMATVDDLCACVAALPWLGLSAAPSTMAVPGLAQEGRASQRLLSLMVASPVLPEAARLAACRQLAQATLAQPASYALAVARLVGDAAGADGAVRFLLERTSALRGSAGPGGSADDTLEPVVAVALLPLLQQRHSTGAAPWPQEAAVLATLERRLGPPAAVA